MDEMMSREMGRNEYIYSDSFTRTAKPARAEVSNLFRLKNRILIVAAQIRVVLLGRRRMGEI